MHISLLFVIKVSISEVKGGGIPTITLDFAFVTFFYDASTQNRSYVAEGSVSVS